MRSIEVTQWNQLNRVHVRRSISPTPGSNNGHHHTLWLLRKRAQSVSVLTALHAEDGQGVLPGMTLKPDGSRRGSIQDFHRVSFCGVEEFHGKWNQNLIVVDSTSRNEGIFVFFCLSNTRGIFHSVKAEC